MSKPFKGSDRSSIVERRWKARQLWHTIEVPSSICVETVTELGNRIFNKNEHKHYLAISNDNPHKVSYARIASHKFNNERRVKTTLHRYLYRNFEDAISGLSERGVECFIERFKAAAFNELLNLDDYFTVVRGAELHEAYRIGYAEGSCMTGGGAEYAVMYKGNPDTVSLLKYDDGEYKGRALLWQTNQNVRLCDRIYPNSGPHHEKYKLYCAKHGILIREHHSCPSSDVECGHYPKVLFEYRYRLPEK